MATHNVIEFARSEPAFAEEARIAASIVGGIRGGNADAETDLVERYSRGLRYLLKRRIGDEERARDSLQETFCIAIEKLRKIKLESPERLAGYLRGIAIRVALNAGRQRKREAYPIDIDAVAAIPDNAARQFQQVSTSQTLTAVRRLVDSMPVERDRDLLIRMYVYDQDKQEICRALGLDSLHFNRVLFRAKGRFRKIMEESREGAAFVPTKDG